MNAQLAVPVSLLETLHWAMTKVALALLALTVSTRSPLAADTKSVAVPGADDLTRYIATRSSPGGQTTLRDASGRTLGSANKLGLRTTMFRDSSGHTTGSATTQGSQTVFRDASGRTLWTATTSGGQTVTYRDAAGRVQRTASESGRTVTFRDPAGRTTSTVQRAGSSATLRDASGRTLGTSLTTTSVRAGNSR